MVEYKCFTCRALVPGNIVDRRIRCPYCGSKILFKPQRKISKVIKAI